MKQVLTMLALATLVVGCAGRTAMYDAPDKDDQVAVIGVANRIDTDDGGGNQGSAWQAPGSNQPARVGVFKVDGERTSKTAGNEKARLRAGEHTIQVYADKAGSLRFGDFTYSFEAGKTYSIRIYSASSQAFTYRAELVNTAKPDRILEKVRF